MNRHELCNGFDLNDYRIVDEEVRSEGAVRLHALNR